MKTSDEKLNDALRAALKRKFDDLELQPAPTAFSRITEALREGSAGYYLLTITLAILFIGVGLVRKERGSEKTAMTRAKLTVRPPVSSQTNHVTPHKVDVIAHIPTADRQTEKKYERNERTSRPQKLIQQHPKPMAANEGHEEMNEVVAAKNTPGATDTNDQPDANTSSDMAIITDSREIVTPSNLTTLLQPLGFASLPAKVDLPEIAQVKNPVRSRPAHTVTMLFNVQTLYTLQRLTINPTNDGEFRQNLRFGKGVGRESVGYKVRAGFELKGFEYLFSYSHFWQGIYYDAATSNYVVDYSKPDQYTVTREWEGAGGTIHIPYMLAGLGVNKKFTWGKSAGGQNYGKAGVEYSRALHRNQGIWWINASVGREFYFNRNTLISVGPFAEFTPFKLWTGDPRFSVQPYRVGLTMGIGVIPR